MRRIGVLVLMGALFLFPVTAVGQDVAVTEIYKTKLSVYSEASGETKIAQVLEDDVALPALQLGNESDYGFIMVRFIFKDSSKTPIQGWINAAFVKTDKRRRADIVTDCTGKGAQAATATRGTRALGDKC